MAKLARPFRKPESLKSEQESRDAVAPFLVSRGFTVEGDQRSIRGTATSQIVTAVAPNGMRTKMRVRLCWRWGDERERYSAAQLRARLIDGSWEKTLDAIVARDVSQQVSHALLFQRWGERVEFAALIPVTELAAIWFRQRELSDELIAAGKMGRITKNHAANGESPTVWLMDERTPDAHRVPDVLWGWTGVIDLAQLPPVANPLENDDSLDDIGSIDYASVGSDGASRVLTQRSHVRRDPRVRKMVLERATRGCERKGCGSKQSYPGFLDVHHILGVETSDRYWNCVALCPNCHRDAHFAPDRDQINQELLEYAQQFKPD